MVRKLKIRFLQVVNKFNTVVLGAFSLTVKLDMLDSQSVKNHNDGRNRTDNETLSASDEETQTNRPTEGVAATDKLTSLQQANVHHKRTVPRCVRFADKEGRPLEKIFQLDENKSLGGNEDLHTTAEPTHRMRLNLYDYERDCPGPQPVSLPDFYDSLSSMKVRLENVRHDNVKSILLLTVLAVSTDRSKHVTVRFTSNDWKTYEDRPGNETSSRGCKYDRFLVEIPVPKEINLLTETKSPRNLEMQFAVRYDTEGQSSWWDNNFGCYYRLKWMKKENLAS